MASTNRGTDAGLTTAGAGDDRAPLHRQLFAEPYRFQFFAAVRILQRLNSERQPVGFDTAPDDEAVRFRVHPSLNFPASELCKLVPPRDEQHPAEITVAFLGLIGSMGALPRFYTELLLERIRKKDRTLQDFLDLFHHRLISLFFRAWEKYRFWFGSERAELAARARRRARPREHRWFVVNQEPAKKNRAQLDPFGQCLLDLGGTGTPALRYDLRERESLQARTWIDDETLRHYAGILSQQHRTPVALEGLLAAYFALSAEIDCFRGQWLLLDREFQTSLTPRCPNTVLGQNAVAGERVWDVQGRFRVRLGPLGYDQFLRYLPCGDAFRPLSHLVRLYAGMQFDFDVQLVLRHDEVPWCRLGGSGGDAARLGWNTWLRNDPFVEHVADTVLLVDDDVSCFR